MLDLQSPAAFEIFTPYQIKWLTDKSPLKLGRKSRRIGWTWTESFDVVSDRVEGINGNYYLASIDATATGEFVGYCDDWSQVMNAVAKVTDEEEIVDDSKITQKVITFENGRKIVAGSSNPRFFRSKGGTAGWDEAAFSDDGKAMFKALHATSQFWGYPAHIWSSENGEETFFHWLITEAQAGRLAASVHTVTILDAVDQGIVERIIMRKKKLRNLPKPDAKARQEWLDQMRATCPDQATWDEEYMCIASSAGSTFLPADLIRSCEEANLKVVTSADAADLAEIKGDCYAGVDVGRSKDLTVITVAERVGDVLWTRALIRLKAMSYQAQEDIMVRLMSNGAIKRLCIDKGLIGGMLTERLQDKCGKYRVEGVQLTAPVQSELAMPLRATFEDRSIRIPADPALREALRKPRKLVVGNNIRFETPRDDAGHCDEFWSYVLLVAAADMRNAPLPAPMYDKPEGW